ncbi:hypothetical protein [Oceanospirillum sediminis]|uniref:Uncharacterized protein n=1 Tax=Oceanospirillum sediminis TaxID=2760088 RepID=A0A839IYQ6_9GAMM|nr:hypothetical protein [Oceanospirillum sediminis]MBB1489497.1 hypothetical protein [Oceanospirillum sediminis]
MTSGIAKTEQIDSPLKRIPVRRDHYGNWTHPHLPDWSDQTSSVEMERWTQEKGIHSKIVHIGNRYSPEIVERWLSGETGPSPDWPAGFEQDGYMVLSVSQIGDDIIVWLARSVKIQKAA